ncbi:MAG: preprotein translocase subunit YajC [Clostridia bacterium]|nr:preprotein translocase subunit YajC [Deltaproteobacteria bacterium]
MLPAHRMLVHFLNNMVVAQAATNPMGQISSLAMICLMFAVIYFLLIRPAKKQRKDHTQLLTMLKKDDEVVTSGGIWGRIIAIDEKVCTLEIADKVRVRILRDRIQDRWPTAQATAKTDKPGSEKRVEAQS